MEEIASFKKAFKDKRTQACSMSLDGNLSRGSKNTNPRAQIAIPPEWIDDLFSRSIDWSNEYEYFVVRVHKDVFE